MHLTDEGDSKAELEPSAPSPCEADGCQRVQKLRGYCAWHFYSRGWQDHPFVLGAIHILGFFSFGLAIYTIFSAPPTAQQEIEQLVYEIESTAEYRSRLVEGSKQDKRRLSPELTDRLRRLEALVDAHKLIVPRACIPLAYYLYWRRDWGLALDHVKQGLRVVSDSDGLLHLLSVGAMVVIDGGIVTEVAQAKEWCRRANLVLKIRASDTRKRNSRYNHCAAQLLLLQNGIGTHTPSGVHDCFSRLGKGDLQAMDPYDLAAHQINLTLIDTLELGAELPLRNGQQATPSTMQLSRIVGLIDGLYATRADLPEENTREWLRIGSFIERAIAELLRLAHVFDRATEHAIAAADGFKKLNNVCAQADALRLAARTALDSNDADRAESYISEALDRRAHCQNMTARSGAAYFLTRCSILIVTTQNPNACADYLWNVASEENDKSLRRTLVEALLALRRDRLSTDPPYWESVLRLRDELRTSQ